MSEILRVDDITVRFGGVTAVENVNLQINDGQLIGFIGPNGAGKTTLMRAITGMVKPQTGSVLLEGINITQLPTHLRIRAGLALDIVLPYGRYYDPIHRPNKLAGDAAFCEPGGFRCIFRRPSTALLGSKKA